MAKTLKYFLLLAFALLCSGHFLAQQNKTDSLILALKNAGHDSTKMAILFELVENSTDDNAWPKFNEQAYELAQKLNESSSPSLQAKGKKGLADALNNKGLIYNSKGEISTAIDYWEKSLQMQEELLAHTQSPVQRIEIKKGLAASLNNVGFTYFNQGHVEKALEHLSRSLRIQEEIGNKPGLAALLNNIGIIYSNQNDIKAALKCYNKSLLIYEEIGEKSGAAKSLINIGSVYDTQGKYEVALAYFERSLRLQADIGDKPGVANSLNHIGSVYCKQNNLASGLDYFNRSLKIREELGDKESIAICLTNIGTTYFVKKDYTLALPNANRALALSKELGFPLNISSAERLLSKIDSARGDYNGAYEHYKQHIIFRDSLNNESTRKASIKNQLKYEFSKKEAIIKEQQDKERAIANEKNRFQQIVIGSVIVGLVLVIIFALFVFRSLKITRKQKIIIEQKQKEILDSIHYAKKIQMALLPTDKFVERILDKSK